MSVADLEEGYLWTQVNEPTTESPENGGVVLIPAAIVPMWSGTMRNGFWREDTNDLHQGDYTGRGVNVGAAFYGPYLSSVGSFAAMTVRMTRIVAAGSSTGLAAPTMRLLEGQEFTGAYPTVLATAPGPSMAPGETVDWGVPASWLPQIQTGQAGGIGIGLASGSTPYLVIDGELQLLVDVYTAPYGGLGLGPFGVVPFGGR